MCMLFLHVDTVTVLLRNTDCVTAVITGTISTQTAPIKPLSFLSVSCAAAPLRQWDCHTVGRRKDENFAWEKASVALTQLHESHPQCVRAGRAASNIQIVTCISVSWRIESNWCGCSRLAKMADTSAQAWLIRDSHRVLTPISKNRKERRTLKSTWKRHRSVNDHVFPQLYAGNIKRWT